MTSAKRSVIIPKRYIIATVGIAIMLDVVIVLRNSKFNPKIVKNVKLSQSMAPTPMTINSTKRFVVFIVVSEC